jgi:FkbM family methyltransferase
MFLKKILKYLLGGYLYSILKRLRKNYYTYFHKKKIIMPHDGNITLVLPDNEYKSYVLQNASKNHEILKRNTINFLFDNNIFKKKSSIVDIGCNCGDNALPWAIKLKKINGKIYAIDPSINNLNYIKTVCVKNNIDNLITIQKALCEESNKKMSIIEDDDNEMFQIEIVEYKDEKYKNIFCETLDILSKENFIQNIDFIHIDAEKMDYEILIGSKNTISKYKPVIVNEIFFNSPKQQKIINFFLQNNYDSYIINENSGNLSDVRNIISFHKENFNSNLVGQINLSLKKKNLSDVKSDRFNDFLFKNL